MIEAIKDSLISLTHTSTKITAKQTADAGVLRDVLVVKFSSAL